MFFEQLVPSLRKAVGYNSFMFIKRTVPFILKLSKKQEDALDETIDAYSRAYCRCLDIAWDEKKVSQFTLHHLTYSTLRDEIDELGSGHVCSAIKKAAETMRSIKAIINKGKKASKPESELIPIRLDKNSMSFRSDKDILSVKTNVSRLKILVPWYNYAEQFRDWDCKAGEICRDRKGVFILRLIFKKEVEKPERTGHVVGFNRGLKHTIVSSDNRFINDRMWTDKERQYLALRSRLQCSGSRSAKRHLQKLARRVRNFNQNCDRIFAKEVCEGLVPGDTIVLEKIKNIRKKCGAKGKVHKKHSSKIGRWRFNRLALFIEQYADFHGIYVDYVSAVDISVTCSHCGIVCPKNLKRKISLYICDICGLKSQMDINAAKNVVKKWRMTIGSSSGAPANRPIVAALTGQL